MTNLFSNIPHKIPDEFTETLIASDSIRIERIISKGHKTPEDDWYDQEENEWVLVIKGEATLLFEEDGREIQLKEGGYINLPAHQKHRVSWTPDNQETIWLAVFYR